MDGTGSVTLYRVHGATTDRRGNPRAGVPQVFTYPDYPSDGRGQPDARNAGHGGVPTGHELHVRATQDRSVPGRPEQAGPDTTAGRLRHRRPYAARRHTDAHDQRTPVGRPWLQQHPLAVRARRLRVPQHRQGPRTQDQFPQGRGPRRGVHPSPSGGRRNK